MSLSHCALGCLFHIASSTVLVHAQDGVASSVFNYNQSFHTSSQSLQVTEQQQGKGLFASPQGMKDTQSGNQSLSCPVNTIGYMKDCEMIDSSHVLQDGQ